MLRWTTIHDLTPAQWSELFDLTHRNVANAPVVSSQPPLAADLEAFRLRRTLSLLPLRGQESVLYRDQQPCAWLRHQIVAGRLSFSPGGPGLNHPDVIRAIGSRMEQAMDESGARNAWLEASSDALIELSLALGAKLSEPMIYLELDLNKANWELIRGWKQNIPAQNPGFSLAIHLDRPESMLDDYVALYDKLSLDRPRVDPIGPDYRSWSAAELHNLSEVNRQIGRNTLTLMAIGPEGEAVALTDINLDRQLPDRAYQGMTGVLPQWRGKGIGRWLKAEALLGIRELFPKVQIIDSDTHRENEPMLRLNREMGYTITREGGDYRIERDKLRELTALAGIGKSTF